MSGPLSVAVPTFWFQQTYYFLSYSGSGSPHAVIFLQGLRDRCSETDLVRFAERDADTYICISCVMRSNTSGVLISHVQSELLVLLMHLDSRMTTNYHLSGLTLGEDF